MHSAVQSFIAFALLLSFAFASPIQQQRSPAKRSFKVSRIHQRNYVPNGAFALRRAHNKFGISSPPPVEGLQQESDLTLIPVEQVASNGTSSSGDNGSVAANGAQNDAEFLSPISIGGQTMVMDFDSGSSDLWVFNTKLPAQSQTGHTIYDPTKSTTFQQLQGSTFNISYGDGSFAEGQVGTDTVDIGGATVTSQAIELATQVATSFIQDTASNGLVGLAFSKLNTVKPQPQKTFFDNVAPNLSQPVFTANLKHGTAGAYTFGEVDSTQFTGSLVSVPINNANGFWEFTSQSIAVGSGAATAVQGGSGTAIADTGTSLLIVDPAVVQAYWSQVTGAQNNAQAGGVIFPCAATLPSVSLAIGTSYMATISGSLLNFAQAGADSASGTSYCFGALQSNGGANLQIYGDVFFKSQFVAFDMSGPSLGLAPHAA